MDTSASSPDQTEKLQEVSSESKKRSKLLPILAIALALPLTLILLQQTQDIRQHAAVESVKVQPSSNTTQALEGKIAGIGTDGKLVADRAEDIARTNPKGFATLVAKGLAQQVPSPTSIPVKKVLPAVKLQAASGPSISACTNITSPGNYVLTNDIAGTGPCINVHDTQNVTLDCQNHTISLTMASYPAVALTNVSTFSIKNCTIKNNTADFPSLQTTNVTNGNVQNSIFQGFIDIHSSNYLQVFSNTINPIYQQTDSSYNNIHDNTFTNTEHNFLGTNIGLTFGSNNTVRNNVIDGQWDGIDPVNIDDHKGADDGIVLQGETQDTISGNTIRNVWDCGIETLNLVQNTQILNNTIINAGMCAIGGWYWNSWLNNTVSGNVADYTTYLFSLFNTYGIPTGQQVVYFKNNTFSKNTLFHQRTSSYIGPVHSFSALIDFEYTQNRWLTDPSQMQTGNNLFLNNDFNSLIASPFAQPASMIADLGGNLCLSVNDTISRPIKCAIPAPVPPGRVIPGSQGVTLTPAPTVAPLPAPRSSAPTTSAPNLLPPKR